LDKYTDTTIYFLTWGATDGLRAKENDIFQILDNRITIGYYTSFSHVEQNPMEYLPYTFHPDRVESQFPFWIQVRLVLEMALQTGQAR